MTTQSSTPTSVPSITLLKENVIISTSAPTSMPSLSVLKDSGMTQSNLPTGQPTSVPSLSIMKDSGMTTTFPTGFPSSRPSSQPSSQPSILMKSNVITNLVNKNLGFNIVMACVVLFGIGLISFIVMMLRKNSHNNNNKAIRKHLSAISLQDSQRNTPVVSQFRSKRMEEYFTLEEDDKEEFNNHPPLLSATRIVNSNPMTVQYSQNESQIKDMTRLKGGIDDDVESVNPLMK